MKLTVLAAVAAAALVSPIGAQQCASSDAACIRNVLPDTATVIRGIGNARSQPFNPNTAPLPRPSPPPRSNDFSFPPITSPASSTSPAPVTPPAPRFDADLLKQLVGGYAYGDRTIADLKFDPDVGLVITNSDSLHLELISSPDLPVLRFEVTRSNGTGTEIYWAFRMSDGRVQSVEQTGPTAIWHSILTPVRAGQAPLTPAQQQRRAEASEAERARIAAEATAAQAALEKALADTREWSADEMRQAVDETAKARADEEEIVQRVLSTARRRAQAAHLSLDPSVPLPADVARQHIVEARAWLTLLAASVGGQSPDEIEKWVVKQSQDHRPLSDRELKRWTARVQKLLEERSSPNCTAEMPAHCDRLWSALRGLEYLPIGGDPEEPLPWKRNDAQEHVAVVACHQDHDATGCYRVGERMQFSRDDAQKALAFSYLLASCTAVRGKSPSYVSNCAGVTRCVVAGRCGPEDRALSEDLARLTCARGDVVECIKLRVRHEGATQ